MDFSISVLRFAINAVRGFQINDDEISHAERIERQTGGGLKDELTFLPEPDVCHTFV